MLIFAFQKPGIPQRKYPERQRLGSRDTHTEEECLRDSKQTECPEPGVGNALTVEEVPDSQEGEAVEQYLPSGRRDPSWLLWIDVWGEALRDAKVRHVSEELDQAWVDLFTEIIAEGAAAGAFVSPDPRASAWRICAMLDGLGLQVVLHARTMTRAEMRDHGRYAAALELGGDFVWPAEPARRRSR